MTANLGGAGAHLNVFDQFRGIGGSAFVWLTRDRGATCHFQQFVIVIGPHLQAASYTTRKSEQITTSQNAPFWRNFGALETLTLHIGFRGNRRPIESPAPHVSKLSRSSVDTNQVAITERVLTLPPHEIKPRCRVKRRRFVGKVVIEVFEPA